MYRIAYPQDNSISIIIPTNQNNLHDLARDIVPKNIPYKIIESSVIPADRTFREAWEIDFNNPDGYGEQNDNN